MTITELISTQEEIIRLQSETIDGLFKILSQHLGTEYIGQLSENKKMSEVSELKQKAGMLSI